MVGRKARRREKSWPAAVAAPPRRRAGPAPAPVRSLSGIPAFPGAIRDVGAGSPGASPAPAQTTAPAPAPGLPAIRKTITIFPVSVGSSTRDPAPDIRRAQSTWRPCGVDIKAGIGQCWKSNILDRKPPVDKLNQTKDPSLPTSEELAMIQYRPGGASALHAYYVPGLSRGDRGEAFIKRFTPDLPEAAVVTDDAAAWDTLAHEIGHILLQTDDHHPDPDNVMCDGASRNFNVDKVTKAQCDKI